MKKKKKTTKWQQQNNNNIYIGMKNLIKIINK
jgi:hypothetical protein